MTDQRQSFLGIGVYTVPEAARLTGIPAPTIRRWIAGYTYTRKGTARTSPPLWERQITAVEDSVALSFRDLLEVRFVQFFRTHGVGWKVVKRAAECASDGKYEFMLVAPPLTVTGSVGSPVNPQAIK